MSLRLFVYYCAICGAWSGFVGWALGALLTSFTSSGSSDYGPVVLRTCLIGMFLGLVVAFGLSFLDAAFNLSLRQFTRVAGRVFAALLVGLFGGLFGSFVAGSLYYFTQVSIVFVIGWTIVGFLIGASISAFEVVTSLITRQDYAGSIKKFVKCLVGGTLGGILGGIIALIMRSLGEFVFTSKDTERLWSPTAIGFVALGACIGLLVGLAQVLLKEAWIKVESGFRAGREMILTREKTSIGRGEGSDIPLFGDSGVEKLHANIVLDGGRYYLEDLQTPGGTYINEQKVEGRAPLKNGDLIRVGRSTLRFSERAKRKD